MTAGKVAATAAIGAAKGAGKRLTDTKAKRYVLVGVTGTGILAAVAAYREDGNAPPQIIAGVAVAGGILAIGSEFAPKIAAGLATLMFLTAAFALGGDAWEGISAMTAPTRPTEPDN